MQWLRKRAAASQPTRRCVYSRRRIRWKGSIKFAESIYMNSRFAVADLPRRDLGSIDVHPLSKRRNSWLAVLEGAAGARVAFNSGQSIGPKNKWALSRERKEEKRERGDGSARSRPRDQRVIAVAFFFERGSNIFVRELVSRGQASRTRSRSVRLQKRRRLGKRERRRGRSSRE